MIIEEGRWQRDIFGKECWDINYSSILTDLIHDAGRWCESYASDLFILWNCDIEKNLTNDEWKGGTYHFGFRQMGVDGDGFYENNKDTPYYYRKERELKVIIEGKDIRMELK